LRFKKITQDRNVANLKQHVQDLEEQLLLANNKTTTILVDYLAMEDLANARLQQIPELEALVKGQENMSVEPSTTNRAPDVESKQECSIPPSEEDCPVHPSTSPTEAATNEPSADTSLQKEVAELKQLVQFYKQNSERTTMQVLELQSQLKDGTGCQMGRNHKTEVHAAS
jgi:hypothetical protein